MKANTLKNRNRRMELRRSGRRPLANTGGGLVLLTILLWGAGGIQAENLIQVGYAEGSPGDTGVPVIVTATLDSEIHGYSLALSYPSEALALTDFSVNGTHVKSLSPEFAEDSINNELGVAVLGVIVDFDDPVEGRSIAATSAGQAPQIIARLTFSVKGNALGGLYPLRLVDGIGTPASFNRFTNAGTSITPTLVDGSFFVSGGNVLTLEKKIAFAGASPNLPIVAYAQHPDPLAGFSIAFNYHCNIDEPLAGPLALVDATYSGTTMVALVGGEIEFFDTDVDPTSTPAGACRSRTGVIFDFAPPFDGQELPPETRPFTQSIMKYSFNVLINADDERQFQDLTLENLTLPGALNNTFLVGDRSVLPRRVHGKIYFSEGSIRGRVVDAVTGEGVGGVQVVTDPDGFSATSGAGGDFLIQGVIPGLYSLTLSADGYYSVLHGGISVSGDDTVDDAGDLAIYSVPFDPDCPNPPCEGLFRRGYVNPDLRADISDAVWLLGWLFQGGPAPDCMEAADANNDNRNDISDAIWILTWLFAGGAPPPPPFDECGLDNDGGNLGCETTVACP